LSTKVLSGKPIQQGRSGEYHGYRPDQDYGQLLDFYANQGFFQAELQPVKRRGNRPGEIRLVYLIREGIRYKVRNVAFEGNTKIPDAQLGECLELRSGKPFIEAVHDADRKRILAKHAAIGCKDTRLTTEAQLTDELGVVDLVYKIEEGANEVAPDADRTP
jgi:outer membrane protein insertion porin family